MKYLSLKSLTIFITAEGLTATPLKYRGSSFHGFALRNSANFASSKVYRASAAATAAVFVQEDEEDEDVVAVVASAIVVVVLVELRYYSTLCEMIGRQGGRGIKVGISSDVLRSRELNPDILSVVSVYLC